MCINKQEAEIFSFPNLNQDKRMVIVNGRNASAYSQDDLLLDL